MRPFRIGELVRVNPETLGALPGGVENFFGAGQYPGNYADSRWRVVRDAEGYLGCLLLDTEGWNIRHECLFEPRELRHEYTIFDVDC
jgi:hypothetical protein